MIEFRIFIIDAGEYDERAEYGFRNIGAPRDCFADFQRMTDYLKKLLIAEHDLIGNRERAAEVVKEFKLGISEIQLVHSYVK